VLFDVKFFPLPVSPSTSFFGISPPIYPPFLLFPPRTFFKLHRCYPPIDINPRKLFRSDPLFFFVVGVEISRSSVSDQEFLSGPRSYRCLLTAFRLCLFGSPDRCLWWYFVNPSDEVRRIVQSPFREKSCSLVPLRHSAPRIIFFVLAAKARKQCVDLQGENRPSSWQIVP